MGHPAGVSYDLYARLAAPHLGKYIPGHPQVVVQSKPGGSGAGAAQFLYSYGPKDGTLLGIFPETIGLTQLTQPDIGKWKVQELAYLGSFANVNSVFMMRKDSPAKTIDELRHIETKVGCNSRLGEAYINPAVLKAYGGFKFRIICGYPGSMEFPMVLARGEVDLISGSWNAWRRRADVIDGTLRPVIQSGLVRHKELPDIPLMQELLDDPRQKQVVVFLSSGSAIGRAPLVHGAVPPDRIAALRTAFDQMVKDPNSSRRRTAPAPHSTRRRASRSRRSAMPSSPRRRDHRHGDHRREVGLAEIPAAPRACAMKLYDYAFAPNPRRVRIFLAEKARVADDPGRPACKRTVQPDIPRRQSGLHRSGARVRRWRAHCGRHGDLRLFRNLAAGTAVDGRRCARPGERDCVAASRRTRWILRGR